MNLFIDDYAPLGADHDGARRDVTRQIRHRISGRTPGSASGDGWLDRARCALAAGDYHAAAFAAQQASSSPATADVLGILARAHAGLGCFEEAVTEARRAVQLAPRDAENHLTLAGVFEELGNWSAALQCYQVAERIGPDPTAARAGTASVLLRLGDGAKARRILEAIYARSADKRLAGDHLGLALTEVAEQVPRVRDSHTYFITSPEEIDQMRVLLGRAAEVTGDPDLRAGIARIRAYVEACARHVLLPTRLFRGVPGYACLALVGVLLAVAFAVPWFGVAPFVAGISAAGAAVFGLVRYARVPRWKLNQWAIELGRGGRPQ